MVHPYIFGSNDSWIEIEILNRNADVSPTYKYITIWIIEFGKIQKSLNYSYIESKVHDAP